MKYPLDIQRHIPQKHLTGATFINKAILADFADLIRLSPTSARLLTLMFGYADDKNSLITDCKTLSKLLGTNIDKIKFALRKLIKNGYISMTEVKLQHKRSIVGVEHDRELYDKSNHTFWEVVGEKLICDFKLTGTYNRFIINKNVAKCSSNGEGNNVLKHIKGNLFYDYRIQDNEILWEM